MSWTIAGTEKNPVDLFRSNVSLLLHGDGTNGSTTIIDSSPSPKTLSSTAINSTTEKKFGTASLFFNSSSIILPQSSDLSFGTQDFTIETFILPTSVAGTHNIFSARNASSNGLSFRVASSKLDFFIDNVGTGLITGATTLAANTSWYHVALTRQGNVFKIWLNGNNDGTTGTITASMTSTQAAHIGRRPAAAENFAGYMDEFRITKGIARYTANFTPPTAPFPDI
jgi:hypothetical protein